MKALRIVPESLGTASLGTVILKRTEITSLEVDVRLLPKTVIDVHEEERIRGNLSECLFRHLSQCQPGAQASDTLFTRLTLKDVDLTTCKHTWFTFINLRNLEHLNLEHCVSPDDFLVKIASSVYTPALETFTLLHQTTGEGDKTMDAVEDLLRHPTQTLRKLMLSIREASKLPAVNALRAHRYTLEVLQLDILPSMGTIVDMSPTARESDVESRLHYDCEDLARLVGDLPAIKELAIGLPRVNLLYGDLAGENEDFAGSVDLIASCRRLTRLNILNWPIGYVIVQRPGYAAATAPQVARTAAYVFGRHRQYSLMQDDFLSHDTVGDPTLKIVAFGVNHHATLSPEPAYFVQSKVHALGKTTFSAQAVELAELRKFGSRSDILEHPKRDFNERSRRSFSRNVRSRPHSPGSEGSHHGGWER